MKLWACVVKTFKENIRDWKVLAMVLVFAPFFVLLMKLFYGGEPTTYKIGVLNNDIGNESIRLIDTLKTSKGSDDSLIFKIIKFENYDLLNKNVKDKNIDLGMVIPEDYSKLLLVSSSNKVTTQTEVEFLGSLSNVKYTVAAVLVSDAIYKQGMTSANIKIPSTITENFLEKKQPLNEFESYVPGLIALAVLMILFTACASIVKENDKRTLIRLKLSNLGSFNFLLGISIVQAIVAVLALAISYGTAILLGYKPEGNFGPVLIVGIVSSFSMVAVSLVVASFLNTVFDVLTIGCFPFFILMFFSGSMFPLPKVNMFTLGGHTFGITDILPLTHSANAFNKILNFGAGVTEVTFEMVMIIALTIIYFIAGMFLYQKRKLSKV